MTGGKRPSTSSLRRFINSRPYVTISELRRRFALEEVEAVTRISRNGTTAFVGLPEREALKLAELWQRDEIGLEFSVEVRAPAVIGIYPMRVARYVHQNDVHGHSGSPPHTGGLPRSDPGQADRARPRPARPHFAPPHVSQSPGNGSSGRSPR